MIERDMEDLIAEYADDFFPRRGLKLAGRQRSFAGVGRFDLLFTDQFESNILMELKARALKYEDATQVAGYKDELQRLGEKHIVMWLVAPQISTSVREFLDRIGIEYTEIHEAEFRRVAERHGATIKSEAIETKIVPTACPSVRPPKTTPIPRQTRNNIHVETGPEVRIPPVFEWRAVGLALRIEDVKLFDASQFTTMVDDFEAAVPSGRNASLVSNLRSWAADPSKAQLEQGTYCSLLRWVTTSGWRAAVPYAETIWKYLFGSPAPTWYVWDQGKKAYQFNLAGWQTWLASLHDVSVKAERTYKEHNDESAWNWPIDKQCQCEVCQRYLRARNHLANTMTK